MKIFNNYEEVAEFLGCNGWEVDKAFQKYVGFDYMVVNDVELRIVVDNNKLKFVHVDKNDNEDYKEFMMKYELKNYVWKVYVDDIEGWQEVKQIKNITNKFWGINRATIITSNGTQLHRRVKFVIDEEDEELKSDGCIYFYEKVEEDICL